ncbi:MAG: GspE/PulE family protein [Candidatus Rokuibacteriota bacterium]
MPAPSALKSAGTSSSSPLGELVVEHGLISEPRLGEILAVQQKLEEYKPLGELLVEQGVISAKQLNVLLDRYHKRSRLGEVLVRSGMLTEEQLRFALSHQTSGDLRLGDVLLQLNLVTDLDLRQALCKHLNLPFVDLDSISVDPALAGVINRDYARRHRVMPIASLGNCLTVVLDDPTDTDVVAELEASLGCTVSVACSTREGFLRAFPRVYEGETAEAVEHTHRLELIAEPPIGGESARGDYRVDGRQADDIFRRLLTVAVDAGASDIHLETLDARFRIRFRIDGLLQELHLGNLESSIQPRRSEIISRIKVLAGLDIAERRRPQDGSFRARFVQDGKITKLNFRVSVVRGYFGENAVVRILDYRKAPPSLDALGFSDRVTRQLEHVVQQPAGMVLLTGPTGCGKSTTLYAALMTIHRPGIRIVTVEDPVEHVFEEFTQSEVHERAGNTFASYLRAFLRHDPEVMMVGEIRDSETADLAIRAAQTGHLLLSTVHTIDAVSAVGRLENLGIHPNLLTSSLVGVMSQRLIRLVCPSCREADRPSATLLAEFFETPPSGAEWYRGRGCPRCHFTGYRGRTGVGELWLPSGDDIRLMSKGAPVDELRASAVQNTITMAEDVGERLFAGKTTLAELLRVLPYHAIQQFRGLRPEA